VATGMSALHPLIAASFNSRSVVNP